MAAEKTLALVLRVIEFSETSCVVTLFTRDFGKIGALAKGARRPKSPFEAALDLLCLCRIVFLHKSTDTLNLLTEAKLERRFRAGTRDLARLYAGFYVAELLNEMTDSGDPHPDLFDAADETLRALDGQADVFGTLVRFEFMALRVLGHLPSLDRCVGCGAEVEAKGRVAFGQVASGVLCARCRVGQRQVISISAEAMQTMRVLAQEEGRQWLDLTVASRVQGEIRGVLNHYLASLLGQRPRMQKYLGEGFGEKG